MFAQFGATLLIIVATGLFQSDHGVAMRERIDRAINSSAPGWVFRPAEGDRPSRRAEDGVLLRWRRSESVEDLSLLIQECSDASAAEGVMRQVILPIPVQTVKGVGDAAVVAHSGATNVYFRVGRFYARLRVPVSGETPDTPAELRSSPVDVAVRIAQRVARELANQ